ncbi:unnamed protein product [Mytilus edulis]|uniref:Uncharacterized protein n=1 Tax=Mytilus edulis TaxID=6550 RepID=A0A8S3TVR3_MYTED|nr:unnamed protein product [Mytilus edulis]
MPGINSNGVCCHRNHVTRKAQGPEMEIQRRRCRSNACVGGALLGCKLGMSALPESWLTKLLHKDWLDNEIKNHSDCKIPDKKPVTQKIPDNRRRRKNSFASWKDEDLIRCLISTRRRQICTITRNRTTKLITVEKTTGPLKKIRFAGYLLGKQTEFPYPADKLATSN